MLKQSISAEHVQKLHVIGFRSVILGETNCLFNRQYSSTKFEFEFWPKFPNLDLKAITIAFTCYLKQKAKNSHIVHLQDNHQLPKPMHRQKLDKIVF
jgi:hypothetical protein